MTKKAKQSKKPTKDSKRTKGPAQPEEEIDTATQSAVAEAPQAKPATPEPEVAVESQQAVAATAPATPATPAAPSNPVTRSEAAKANIREGIRLHKLAGSPSKAQIVSVLGLTGYLLTWPKRTERFGITPETFQAELAKGVQMKPLVPKTEETKT